MEQPGWRVVILTSIPNVAETLARTVRRVGHSPVAVVSTPRLAPAPGAAANDRVRAARGGENHRLEKQDLEEQGLEVLIAARGAAVEPMLRSVEPDLALTWGFPWLLTQGALDVARLGSVNYHPSLLPRHRGPNPLGWTVRLGDPDYGVTWHRMEAGFDTGPILAQRSTPAADEDTLTDVISRLSILAVRLLPTVFERLAAGDAGDPQPAEGVTEAPPFGEDYAAIDWSMTARDIHTQVRAWAFTLGTRSVLGPLAELDGKTVRVTETTLRDPGADGRRVECGDGPLWILASEPAE
jgi:methionyl-tRNA formyltransferase